MLSRGVPPFLFVSSGLIRLRLTHCFRVPHMWSPVKYVVADPLPCILSASFAKDRELSTLASYGLMLKKGASKRPTSSFTKWAPRALNCARKPILQSNDEKFFAYATRFGRIRMEERFSIHSRLRYLGPSTPTLATHIPKTLDISCVAWKSACHANNGNQHVRARRLRVVYLRGILIWQLMEAIDRRRDFHVV